jgi:hypothetical protein
MRKNLIKCQNDSLSKKTRIEGFILPKWKLFNQFKGKEEAPIEVETTTENIGEPTEKSKIPKSREKSEEITIKVYDETLYSEDNRQKHSPATFLEKKQLLKRSNWESLGTIEHKIDNMGYKQTEIPETRKQTSVNTNKKVDRVLSQTKVRR